MNGPWQAGHIENGVLVGEDGYLFLVGGNHDVLDHIEGKKSPPSSSFLNYHRNLVQREKWASSRNAGYVHIIFPDKQTVLADKFPRDIRVRLGQSYVEKFDDVRHLVCYPVSELLEYRQGCFLKLDTHLSDLGVSVVAVRVAERLTGKPLQSVLARLVAHLTSKKQVNGDLGSKLSADLTTEEVYLSPWWQPNVFSNGLSGNNGLVDVWHSPGARFPQRLLVFGDSFGRSMSKVLSALFTDVVFARTPFFHVDLVDQMRPDYVITDNAERYLSHVSGDWERPSFHMLPYLGGQQHAQPNERFARAFSAMLSYPRKPYQDFIASFVIA